VEDAGLNFMVNYKDIVGHVAKKDKKFKIDFILIL
jgi:hypothetical protein